MHDVVGIEAGRDCRFECDDHGEDEARDTGELLIEPSSANTFVGLRTKVRYDLRDTSTTIELVAVSSNDGGGGVRFKIGPEQNYPAFGVIAGQLLAIKYNPNLPPPVQAAAFDPVQHRFLRMHVINDNTMEWLTSADGQTWVLFASAPADNIVDDTRIELFAVDDGADRAMLTDIGCDVLLANATRTRIEKRDFQITVAPASDVR